MIYFGVFYSLCDLKRKTLYFEKYFIFFPSNINKFYYILRLSQPIKIESLTSSSKIFLCFIGGDTKYLLKYNRITRWFLTKLLLLGALAKLRKATITYVMSNCPSVCLCTWNTSAATARILMKFDILDFFSKILLKPEKTSILHENVFTFMTISRWFLLTRENVSYKVAEKIKTHILCWLSENRAFMR
jgi:hypothetical protein